MAATGGAIQMYCPGETVRIRDRYLLKRDRAFPTTVPTGREIIPAEKFIQNLCPLY